MRNSTLRLKERLKCAGGEAPPVSSAVTNPLHKLYKGCSAQYCLKDKNLTCLIKVRKCSFYDLPVCVCFSFLQETPVSEAPLSETASPVMRHADDNRSPSPSLSISGSETSSIMQKLKKMRTHTDEK